MTKIDTALRNTVAAFAAALLCTTVAFTVATAVPNTAPVATLTA